MSPADLLGWFLMFAAGVAVGRRERKERVVEAFVLSDRQRHNCGDREPASGDIFGMCSVCHQRSYVRAVEPVEWATQRAEMCACPCHALNGTEGTP